MHRSILVVLSLAACPGASKPAATTATAPVAAAVAPTPPPPAAAAAAASKVARVVFLDKEHACECTQKAIDASWTALQTAIQGTPMPVERIHLDTQDTMAALYKAKRPLVSVPGLYLLGADDSLVELLQGEVTTEKIRAALGR